MNRVLYCTWKWHESLGPTPLTDLGGQPPSAICFSRRRAQDEVFIYCTRCFAWKGARLWYAHHLRVLEGENFLCIVRRLFRPAQD